MRQDQTCESLKPDFVKFSAYLGPGKARTCLSFDDGQQNRPPGDKKNSGLCRRLPSARSPVGHWWASGGMLYLAYFHRRGNITTTTSGFRGGGAQGARAPPFEIPKRVFKEGQRGRMPPAPPPFEIPKRVFKRDRRCAPPFHKSWIRP